MVDSAREVCGSVKVGEKKLKNVWWNDVIKSAVERKGLLGTRAEVTKDICVRFSRKKKERLKGVYVRAKMR